MFQPSRKKGSGFGFRGEWLKNLEAGFIHRCFDLGLTGFLGVERNLGLSVEMRDAIDVNDTFLLSEEAGESVGAAAADETFDFEESFLAGDSEAGSGEGLFEGRFCHLGGIELDGDGLWSDL